HRLLQRVQVVDGVERAEAHLADMRRLERVLGAAFAAAKPDDLGHLASQFRERKSGATTPAVGWSIPMPWSRSCAPRSHSDAMRPAPSGRIAVFQRSAASLFAAMLTVSACGSQAAQARPSPTPSSTEQPAPSPSPTPTASPPHVFVIVMENRSYSQAMAGT